MIAVLLTINILVVAALIVVVLLQRSEGGALFGGGSFMTGRGAANALTRTTMGLASIFFLTTLTLGYLAGHKPRDAGLIDQVQGRAAPVEPGKATSTDLLRSLGGATPQPAPAGVPATQPGAAAPAQPQPAAPPTDADLLGPTPQPQQGDAPPPAEPATQPPPQRL